MSKNSWQHYLQWHCHEPATGLFVDLSRMGLSDANASTLQPRLAAAFAAMAQLEAGAIANPDEQRMVGHYWLRDASLAPDADIRGEIERTIEHVRTFAQAVHRGEIAAPDGDSFERALCIGIGGSALGPQFVADALACHDDLMRLDFIDNTDPDGIDRVLATIGAALNRTLVVVISKSGGTAETRNGMLEVIAAFSNAGLDFPHHAVAITGVGSALDQRARAEGWLECFPMWDWVGGRTSLTSVVGLLPAALQGIDIHALLDGARAMDVATRRPESTSNPAALLALAWHHAGNGRGDKAMVILPYKDRLLLLSRYLQQLVMESLGKSHDLDGQAVAQGIAVYGNKGSTDQHAYLQQLRDGRSDFFATFIEVLEDRTGQSIEVEKARTSGDYLSGFLYGTRQALSAAGRASITITLPRVEPRTVGALIALYERTVGLYASLININAYHQPGVEAGKRAAGERLSLQHRLLAALDSTGQSIMALAEKLDTEPEAIYQLARHLAANRSQIMLEGDPAEPATLLLNRID